MVIEASAATPEFYQLVRAPADVAYGIVDGLPEGPTEQERPEATFTILAEAVGADGRLGRAVMRGGDVYRSTAVIAVEVVRRLVVAADRPGVMSPAQAYDVGDFLRILGTTWRS